MKTSRWKDMMYNDELDCWVVYWGDNSGYKVRFGIGFKFTSGMEGSFLAAGNGLLSLVGMRQNFI